jgi:hypothetical protein
MKRKANFVREVGSSSSDTRENPHKTNEEASKTFNGLLKPVETKEQQPRGVNGDLDAQSLEKTKEELTRDYELQQKHLSTVVEQHKQLLATDAKESDLKTSRAKVSLARKTFQRTASELNFSDIEKKHQQDIKDISKIHRAALDGINNYYQNNRESFPREALLVKSTLRKEANKAIEARKEALNASKERDNRDTEYQVLSEKFPRMENMYQFIKSEALEAEEAQEQKAAVAKENLTNLAIDPLSLIGQVGVEHHERLRQLMFDRMQQLLLR